MSSSLPPAPRIAAAPHAQHAQWRTAWGWALGLTVFLTLWRVWQIQHSGMTLFVDEAQYWDWSRHPSWGYFSKPPLIAWLIALVTAVLGNSVLAVKATSLLLFGACALVMSSLARLVLPKTPLPVAPWAVLLWMAMPLVAGLSLFASTDGPLLLCWAGACYQLSRAQASDRLRDWLVLGVIAGLGLLAKYTMAVFLFTGLWALWGLPGPVRGLRRTGPWLALLLALACITPNLFWNADMGYPTLLHTERITALSQRSGGWSKLILFLVGQVAAMGPAAFWWALKGLGADPQTAHAVERRRNATPQLLRNYALAISLPLLLIASIQAVHASSNMNWSAPAHIGLLLLTLAGLLKARRPARALGLIVISNLVLMTAVINLPDVARLMGKTLPNHWDILVRMRGWDAVLEQVRLREAPRLAASIAVASDSRPWLSEITYQWRDLKCHPYAWNPHHRVSNHYELSTDLNHIKGQDILILTEHGKLSDFRPYAQAIEDHGMVALKTGPTRQLSLHMYLLHHFTGY